MTAADLPTLKSRLLAGEVPVGTMAMEFWVPGLAQMARAAGAEFIVYDMEHSGASLESVKAQCAYCRGVGIAPIVRVATASYGAVAGALDVGAHGIMVPMVESASQARDIVSWTRYPPEGRRGAAFGVAHDDYLPGAPAGKMAHAAARTLVAPIIESPAGVENAAAIAAVPGVDVLWLGSFDLTSFMGIAAQFDHPRYLQAEAAVLGAAHAHGKAAGFVAGDGASARECRARGYRMLAVGIDFQLYQRALGQGIAALREG
ncbi:MAG: aldolase/citrate lyase family protein [Rubrivivax sp.]